MLSALLRVSSGATKRMRRRPFGSFTIDAIGTSD
jgi:hypothetical protein